MGIHNKILGKNPTLANFSVSCGPKFGMKANNYVFLQFMVFTSTDKPSLSKETLQAQKKTLFS